VKSAETSPTARALRALELLQHLPGITAADLAERLGVTDRAARRYVEILRESGIPVVSNRGRHGGYRVGRGLRLPPLVFTATEALGLVMAVLDGQHAAADAEDPVGAALGKLIRALPDGVAGPAATMREHALAVPDRSGTRPDPAITTELVAAVAGRHRVRLRYAGASGARWEPDVDPWAVVVRYGRWYLLCFAHDADAIRTLRIDRIRAVELRDEPFRPPDDLDPIGWLEQHLGAGWPYATRVVFEAPYAHVARFVPAPMGHLEPIDDGARCVLTGTTNNPEGYAGERLAAIPYPMRVEGGPELRAAVAAVAQRMANAVADPGTTTRAEGAGARPEVPDGRRR
jgi:predicted DNA-binding transcriptional regulator YafY